MFHPKSKRNNIKGSVNALLVICLAFFGTTYARAALVKMTLTNGLIQIGEVSSADINEVMWKEKTALTAQAVKLDQIARIDFPAPDLWKKAIEHFHQRDYQKAIPAFTSIADNPKAHYYPAPGNFASLALLRLIDCYNETGNTAKMIKIAEGLEPKSLAVPDRSQLKIIDCWVAFGNEKWEEALSKVEAIEANPLNPGSADLAFIKGVALEKTGKAKEAIIAYGGAYSLEFGGQSGISKRALQNSANLLETLKTDSRHNELRALIHTYVHVYNKGKLWDGASPLEKDLFAEKLEFAKKRKLKDGEDPASPVMALRFRQNFILQRGKQKAFIYTPSLPPFTEKLEKGDNLINSTTISKLTSTGVSLSIKANDKHGITYQRNNGLGVISEKQSKADASIAQKNESLTFTVSGAEAFRIVSITFGGGSTEYELDSGDELGLKVTGLIKEQPAYQKMISDSAKPGEGDSGTDTPSTNFQRIALSGGFIKAEGGSFQITHQKGAFGIDAIAIELKIKEP